MTKPSLGLLAALLPLCAFANVSEWKNGEFEVGGVYAKGDSHIGNLNYYGGYVASGYYFGNHLLQLQVTGMTSEGFESPSFTQPNPLNTAQTLDYKGTHTDAQEYPIWFKYAYGFSFGPNDAIRLEAGPLLGLRIVSQDTRYNVTVSQPGQPTQTYNNESDRSGGVCFDYGLHAAVRVRLADHWKLVAEYQYVRSTGFDYESRIKPLGAPVPGGQSYAFIPYKDPEHGTNFASLGVEYRF